MRVYQVDFYGLTMYAEELQRTHRFYSRTLAEAKKMANEGLRSELRHLKGSEGIESWTEVRYGEPYIYIHKVELKPLSKGVAIAMLNSTTTLPGAWDVEATNVYNRRGWEQGHREMILSWCPADRWVRRD